MTTAMRILATVVSLAALASLASAQIVPLGPFVGTDQEGFETQKKMSFDACVDGRVFNGQADACTPGKSAAHVTSGWWYSCGMQERSGSYLFGGAGSWCEFTFDAPVTRFGGFFGTNAGVPDGTIEFYDGQGVLLAREVVVAKTDCSWTWNGWQAPVGSGFARAKLVGNHSTGGYLLMDDLEADFGPSYGLVGVPAQLSIAQGGSQTLSLSADPAHAGRSYLVLGSASGVAPGLAHVGKIVPLNYDAYFLYTLQNPNSILLPGSGGVLDGNGSASAQFTLPLGLDPTLAGLVVSHAAVVLDPQPSGVYLAWVSNTVPMTFAP